MQAATNTAGITIINFGIGSANASTVMDLFVSEKIVARSMDYRTGVIYTTPRVERQHPLRQHKYPPGTVQGEMR